MRALTSRSPPPPLHTPPATSFWFNIHPRSQTPRFGLGKRGAAFANLQSNPYMYMPYRNSHSLSLLLQPQEASSPALNNPHHHSPPPPIFSIIPRLATLLALQDQIHLGNPANNVVDRGFLASGFFRLFWGPTTVALYTPIKCT